MCASEPILPCSCAWNLPVQQGLFVPESGGLDGRLATSPGPQNRRPGPPAKEDRANDHQLLKDK